MAEENTFYGKTKKRKFFFRAPNSDRTVMIQATTQAEADRLFDEMDKSQATYVAKDANGNDLVRKKSNIDGGGIDADVVLESVDGQRFLVGDGYSTSEPDAINRFIEEGITTENLISESDNVIIQNTVNRFLKRKITIHIKPYILFSRQVNFKKSSWLWSIIF